ncbi:MAG: hypothetical protein LBC86_00655 [Oscillospiraceae bacterium]|nr:hypothetical protein [Oscillospiraceae bacterium]
MKKSKCFAAILAVLISIFMLASTAAFAEVEPDGGNAIIGGTFYDEEGEMEWVRFDEFPTAFTIGAPFSVMVDLGGETNTHGEASWGFITVVQTDMDVSAAGLDAYIERITVDGERNVMFNEDNIEVSNERGEGGIRISLTNGWASDPVVISHERIGDFSTLEVVMAFVEYGDPRPDFSAFALAPVETPISDEAGEEDGEYEAGEDGEVAPPPMNNESANPEASSDGGFPAWIIIAIAAAVVGIITIIIAAAKKK